MHDESAQKASFAWYFRLSRVCRSCGGRAMEETFEIYVKLKRPTAMKCAPHCADGRAADCRSHSGQQKPVMSFRDRQNSRERS